MYAYIDVEPDPEFDVYGDTQSVQVLVAGYRVTDGLREARVVSRGRSFWIDAEEVYLDV